MGLVLFILLLVIPYHLLSGYISAGILYAYTGFEGKKWTVACMVLGMLGLLLQILVYFLLLVFVCPFRK